MFITRALLFYVRRRHIPGKIDIGKHQLVKPVTVRMKKEALASLLLEQNNLSLIQRPYLSEEEESCFDDSEARIAEFHKMRDEHIRKKLWSNYTMQEHFDHLNVSKKWE